VNFSRGKPLDTVTHLQSSQNSETEPLLDTVASLQSQLSAMETFIKRRFDEISMEINATSQQIDMTEEGMAKRFGEILGVMNAISYDGDGDTPANTGVELEAVVAETTKAANEILDATDKINDILHKQPADIWADPAQRDAMLNDLKELTQTIMVSCSFQDITSQRIRKTLESINEIEDRISDTLGSLGIEVPAHPAAETNEHIVKGNSQDDIDALFR
jgi:chemotaxis regulatin CheY-phosphate phosphatase CheZ